MAGSLRCARIGETSATKLERLYPPRTQYSAFDQPVQQGWPNCRVHEWARIVVSQLWHHATAHPPSLAARTRQLPHEEHDAARQLNFEQHWARVPA